MKDIKETLFDRDIRVDVVLHTVSAVHYETLPDAWEVFLEDPCDELRALLCAVFGISVARMEQLYNDEDEGFAVQVAEFIARRSDVNGFLVQYALPVYMNATFEPDGSLISAGTAGFGYYQRHYFFADTLDKPTWERLIKEAAEHQEVMLDKFRAAQGVKRAVKA